MRVHTSNSIGQEIFFSLLGTFLFTLALAVGSLIAEKFPWDRVPYQICLFSMCAWAFFFFSKIASLRLVAFFMSFYYALFGAAEFLSYFTPAQYIIFEAAAYIKKTSMSDLVILLGGLFLLIGAALTANLFPKTYKGWFTSEWKSKPGYVIAFCCWSIGFVALFTVQVIYESLGYKVGFFSHIVSNASYLSLMGGIILIYLATTEKNKRLLLWVTLWAVIACEYILGFVGNTKEISYRLPLLLVLSGFFLRGTFNKKLIIVIVLSFVPYQALFMVYREQIIQVRRMTTLQAMEGGAKTETAVRKIIGREKKPIIKAFFIAIDRVDCRKYIDIITANVGSRVRYQDGETLMYFFYSFVPKIIWAEKPDISVGQLFNHEFKLSASRLTFVPATQLGELYWNFGMGGVLIGMFLIGVVLAAIGRCCSLGTNATVARFIALLVTAYVVVLRFEDGIAVTYSKLIRMMFILFLIDRLIRVMGTVSNAKPPMVEGVNKNCSLKGLPPQPGINCGNLASPGASH